MSRSTAASRLSHLSDRTYLAIVMITATAARFVGLGHASVWHDEGYTMMMAPLPPAEIIHRTALDVHPPLYYLALHFWLRLFGTSEVAIRSLSAVAMLLVIPIMYFLMKRLFNRPVAMAAAWFLALAPFLVRYSQEARMYGLLALIGALATYFLVRALDSNRWLDWLAYAVIIAAGLYTYYYVIFIIAFHWLYVAFISIYPRITWQRIRQAILAPRWLAANAIAVVLFLPWLPTAFHQFTTIQGAYWIPKVNADTIPVTISQFLTYSDFNLLQLPGAATHGLLIPSAGGRLVIVGLLVLAILAYAIWRRKTQLKPMVLMIAYAFLTPILVWALSLHRPIYVDRYFVFAAVAFYCLLAVVFAGGWPGTKRPRWLAVVIALASATFLFGLVNVYTSNNYHHMRELAADIQSRYQEGDDLINGDFYTFFDYHYYNQTGHPNQAYIPGGFPGCCEGKSMLADQPLLVVHRFSDVHPANGYAWIIGRPGAHDYFDSLPPNWSPAAPRIVDGDLAAQRFRVR